MGIVSSNKTIGDVESIDCQGILEVQIGIQAAPDIITNPTDIVLILDRSSSMAGAPFDDMKGAVNTFIDIISEATGGAPDEIGAGSHIGIVSFDATAVQNTALITSVADLKEAVNALEIGRLTNHGAAFEEATDLLETSTNNNRIMVMFTDGRTTTGPDPDPIAEAAKAQGITIYCVGLGNKIDAEALNDWASDPDVTHVTIAPDSSELEQIFTELAANISVPGATNIVIDEEIFSDFIIISTPVASKGNISLLTDTSFQWSIDQLGATTTESAMVSFSIQHVGSSTGLKTINQSISYVDNEGNEVTFPDPDVFVICGPVLPVDICPLPVDVPITGCEDYVEFDAGALFLEDTGRILQLSINLMNVCPNRRVALAVVLTELDEDGGEHSRGIKFYTVPPHRLSGCADVLITCIRFILPDDQLCAERNLQAKFMAHYIDNEFKCCPPIIR